MKKFSKNRFKSIWTIVMVSFIVSITSIYLYADEKEALPNFIEGVATPDQKIEQMKLVAENEYLSLMIDAITSEICIKDKDTGNLFFSNPYDAGQDSIATENVKGQLNSQLVVRYYDERSKPKEINSYTESVKVHQANMIPIENGIKIEYILGKEDARKLIPYAISKEMFEEKIFTQLDEKEQKRLNVFYKLYDLEAIDDKKLEALWTEQFPMVKTGPIYGVRQLNKKEMKEVEEYFKKAGYTFEDMDAEYEAFGYEAADAIAPYFKIPMEYVLDQEDLVVRVPVEEIEYDKSLFTITRLKILPYFSAGTTDGYLFIPDGSGAIIEFNEDRKKDTLLLTKRVYGEDISMGLTSQTELTTPYILPVFGIKTGEQATLGIIEEGAEIANITTEISQIIHQYNTVYPEFDIKAVAVETYGADHGGAEWVAIDKQDYKGNLTIRYKFLDGKQSNYVGMAEAYRQYLEERDYIKQKQQSVDIPLYIETLGSISTRKNFFGISKQIQVPLTTIQDNKELIQQILDQGINNVNWMYRGWQDGGLENYATNNMKIERVLGNEKQFKELASFTKEKDVKFFPMVDFSNVFRKRMFDGFNPSKDISRMLNNKLTMQKMMDLVTGKFTIDKYYAVTPTSMEKFAEGFLEGYKKYDIPAVGLMSIGKQVYSDFNKNNYVNRVESAKKIQGILALCQENEKEILIEGGNGYVIPYANHIVNLPSDCSENKLIDYSIPFVQMVFRTYIDYAGEPLNLSGDYEKSLLKSIETGSGLYYVIAQENESILKNTYFSSYYSVNDEIWIEKIIKDYQKVNNVLSQVTGCRIINHEYIQEDVFRVTYDNGFLIILNYNKEDIEVEGQIIEGMSFKYMS